MTRARDIANLVDANGDVVAAALDNVPASNDASALTTGTLPDGRFPSALPAIDGSALTGIAAFASGTVMLFQQTSSPTGWTKLTTNNDAAIRVVSGSVGTGGSVGLATALGTPSLSGSTGSTTLTISQMPAHTHTVNIQASDGATTSINANSTGKTPYAFPSNSTGGGGSHNHSMSGTATINCKYVDVIAASKD